MAVHNKSVPSVIRIATLLIFFGKINGLKYSASYTNHKVDVYETNRVFTGQGIASGGRIDLSYVIKTNESPSSDSTTSFNINLMLLSSLQYDEWYSDMSTSSSDSFNVICQSPSVWLQTIEQQKGQSNSFGNVSLTVHSTDEYTLVVAFCTLLETKHSFVIDIESSYLNLDEHGQHTQYLQIQEVILPVVFKYLSFIYAILIVLWFYELVINYTEVQFVHIAVLLAIVLQFSNLYIRYIEYDMMNVEGKENYTRFGARKALEYIMDPYCLFLYFFVTMVCMKRYIQLNRQNFLGVMGFWAFYLMVFTLHVSCQYNNNDWSTNGCQPYPLLEYIMRSTIMLMVLVGMNYAIATTRQAILEEATAMSLFIASLYKQLYQAQIMRWAFLGFLLTPTFLVIFQALLYESWKFDWLNYFMEHFLFLLIHVPISLLLLPKDNARYLSAFRNSRTN